MEVMRLHAEQPIDSLSELGVEEPIEQIVTYMMAKRPELRYQTAGSIADQISNFADGPLAVAPPSPKPSTQADFENWLRNKPRLATIPAPTTIAGAAQTEVVIGEDSGTSSHNSPARILQARQRARRRQRILILSTVAVIVVASIGGGIGYVLFSKSNETEVSQPENSEDPRNTDGNPNGAVPVRFDPDAATPQILIADDGEALWESPTQGQPIELRQLPNAPRLLLTLRPADLLATSDGPLVLNALGPAFQEGLEAWQATAGVALDQVERLTISLHDQLAGAPGYRPCYRIQLLEPQPLARLAQSWGQNTGAEPLAGNSLKTAQWQFWAAEFSPTDSAAVQTFVLAAPDLTQQAIARGDSAPTMQPDLRLIAQTADADRHFNLLFLSSNLTNPASRDWFAGAWEPLWQPLQPLLLGGVQAGCLSFHLDQDLYVELAVKGQISQSPEQMAGYLKAELPRWQGRIEQGFAALPANPYWERVRLRYVNWIREGVSMTRVGVEQRLAKANAWLPGVAAHNLIAGSELALATLTAPATGTTESQPTDSVPQNMNELLQRNFDFAVSSNDMINVMGDLQISVRDQYKSLPFEFEIRLMGNDLREEGITQNQRISNFSMESRPLAEILTGLVVTANPDKASKSPADEKQKLLWVAVDDPDDSERKIIMITTRKAALKNNYPLAKVFGGDAS